MTKQNREDAKLDTDKEALRLQSAGDAASNVATDKEALRLQGLGVVARGVAHEIANPVNIILMNAEVAQLSLPDTAGDDEIRNDLTEALAAIVKETRRLGMLAQQIYRFADAER